MTIHDFIKLRPHLFWSTKNYGGLSDEAIVEATLNYGDWNDVRELITLMGIQQVATIFRRRSAIPRSNYRSEVSHYFRLYFGKYA